MRKSLVFKPDIKFRKEYNSNKELSLHILSMKKTDLGRFLKETCYQNPFLTVRETNDKIIEYQTQQESLSSVLFQQLAYVNDEIPEDIFYYLISNLDSNGYFKKSMGELVSGSIYSKKELVQAIRQLQQLDPIGCFCFSLKESLKVQCEMSDCAESETAYILCDFLDELAKKEYAKIQEKSELEYDEIREGFHFIQTLNPKPGAQYSIQSNYLYPEAKVDIVDDQIQIKLLNEDIQVELNEMNEKNLSKELKNLRNEAVTIMNFVQKRNVTLLQILQYVCQRQKEYFLHGQKLCRLTMSEVSQACGIHVSTVSRAVQDKSIEFNNTYIPLRALFIRTGKTEVDPKFVIETMKKWIQEENKEHPLSDEKLSKMFEKEEIQISRRTISKYREAENILNTYDRKRGYHNES